MNLTETMTRFILHWGEMGSRWGVNRSVAQIHALLYLTPDPLTAEDIAATLGIARSNVSTGLKELHQWNLISTTRVLGDRRDRYIAEQDVWNMMNTIIDGRKQREIDPTLEMLRTCVATMESESETPPAVRQRIASTLEFIEGASNWYAQISKLPRVVLLKLMRMGAKVSRLVA